jgi:hypothetical protein
MTGLLDNKVVIVAGLGGIGNGLARRYADEGGRRDRRPRRRLASPSPPTSIVW